MDLSDLKTVVEIAQALITSAALIISGIWAYQKLFIQAEHETAINIELSAKVLLGPHPNVRLIEIRAILVNHGKVPCQIDLDHSWIELSAIVIRGDDQAIEWAAVPYFEAESFKTGPLNIPAGSRMHIVEFAGVAHPGTYRIQAFFAQTHAAGKQFYKRLRQPFPADWNENPSGWDNAVLVHTGADTARSAGLQE